MIEGGLGESPAAAAGLVRPDPVTELASYRPRADQASFLNLFKRRQRKKPLA